MLSYDADTSLFCLKKHILPQQLDMHCHSLVCHLWCWGGKCENVHQANHGNHMIVNGQLVQFHL